MTTTTHPARFRIEKNIAYLAAETLQKELVAELAQNPDSPGTVIFAEHKPVITCGRSGDGSNLLVSPQALADAGVEFHPSGRGGDVTYHGPGQWTVYPILRLAWFNRDLHHYLRLMEDCVMHFLKGYGVDSGRRQGLTGVWIEGKKIAAVGVAVTRWITWHGLAMNIDPDLGCFTRFMHPCGILADQGGVTSLSEVLKRPCTMEETYPRLKDSVAAILDLHDIS